MGSHTRRSFLRSSAAGAAASALSLSASAQPAGANERLNVGLIGTGGRCRHLMPALARVPNVRITALCDVYEPTIDLARRLNVADANPFVTKEHRELLARNDIHAV